MVQKYCSTKIFLMNFSIPFGKQSSRADHNDHQKFDLSVQSGKALCPNVILVEGEIEDTWGKLLDLSCVRITCVGTSHVISTCDDEVVKLEATRVLFNAALWFCYWFDA
ncbi:hypothetical protein MIR68_004109 [Amoeboaphelidium protococcarum]|nr:hypothetical protein MIR68_004109 [Amoeboaphelidium protococcarum]